MTAQQNDAFEVSVFCNISGQVQKIKLKNAHEILSSDTAHSILFAVNSTIAMFQDQPRSTQAVNGQYTDRIVGQSESLFRLWVLGLITLLISIVVPALIVNAFIVDFTVDFIRRNWLIIPAGIVFTLAWLWMSFYLLVRAKSRPRLEFRLGSHVPECELIAPSGIFSIPRTYRSEFVPELLFLTRLGIAKSASLTVGQALEQGLESLDESDYVLGVCSANGGWLCLLKANTQNQCLSKLKLLKEQVPALASCHFMDLSVISRLVWSSADRSQAGVISQKRSWTR